MSTDGASPAAPDPAPPSTGADPRDPAPPPAAERERLQRRTVRTLMVGVLPSGAAIAGSYSAATILADDITGSGTLAGLTAAALTVGGALSAVPLARAMTRHGRRPVLVAAWSLAALGALSALMAAATGAYPLLLVGILAVGTGQAANLAARYAAADLADEHHKARAIGLLVWMGTFGSVLGPTVALGPAGRLASGLGLPDLAGAYLLAVAGFAGAALFVHRTLRPDPLVVAGGTGGGGASATADRPGHLRRAVALLTASPGTRLAVAGLVGGHVVMVAVMSMTPLHLEDGGHTLQVIGLVISVHIIGMYALSPLVGRIVDRVGPRPVLAAGGLLAALGAEIAAHTTGAGRLGPFSGLFLLGLGWSCTLVAGSGLLTVSVPTADRVEAQGAGDLAMTASGALAALTAGAVVETASYHALSTGAALVGLMLAAVAGASWLSSPGVRAVVSRLSPAGRSVR
ncbi:MAG: MFS transporter [Actinomyces sp.]|nr:MAG: MFS transporter [Actinomyces sp.]